MTSAVDGVSQAYATALEKLRSHDPEFVARALGETQPAHSGAAGA